MLFTPVAQYLDTHAPVARGAGLLLAVSGGMDSMVLLHLMCRLARARAWRLVVGHVDHNLRAESGADAAFVRENAAALGLPFEMATLDGAMLRARNGEAAAREARYAALHEMAQRNGLDYVVTAHHADDQAETFLLALLHGAGLEGLTAIAPFEARRLRPLLGVTRAELAAYAVEHGLAWREDATNATDAYTRNRLRHHLLPALSEEQPQAARVLATTCERLREAEGALRFCARQQLEVRRTPYAAEPGTLAAFARRGLDELPTGLRLAMWREALRPHLEHLLGFYDVHWRQIDHAALSHVSANELKLPRGIWVRATRETLFFGRREPD